MRDNSKRRRQYARRKQQFDQLKLQAEILCESHRDEGKASIVLDRMMLIILGIISERKLNAQTRQALASHFEDSVYDAGSPPLIELGGPYERNMLHLSGSFDIGDLAKRLVWSSIGPGTITIEQGG